MAESVGGIFYTVEADTSKLVDSSTSVDASLNRLNKTFAQTDRVAHGTQNQMTKTAQAVKGLGRESVATRSSVSGLYGALAGLVSLRAAQGLIDMADAYNEMAERIAMATNGAKEYEYVQQRILATANATYRPLQEAQELYVLTASTLKGLGYETKESLDIVDSLSYAFVKNATATDRAKTTVDAVTKALNKGKIEADGWQTILAAIPTIVDDIARATGRTTQEVLSLGAQGKLAGRELSESLLAALDENKKAADGMATTVRDGFRNLSNNLSVFIGEANRAHGSTQLISSALIALGENIETVVNLLLVAGAGALAKYIAQLGASVVASGRAVLAARAQAAEELRLAQAHRVATQAAAQQAAANVGLVGSHGQAAAAATAHAAAVARAQAAQSAMVGASRLLMGALGGPVGIIALLASAAVAALTFGRDSKTAAGNVDGLSGAVDGLTASLDQLDRAGLTSAARSIEGRIEEAARLAVNAQDKVQQLQAQLAKEVPGSAAAQGIIRQMEGWGAAYGEAQKQLDVLKKRAEEIRSTTERREQARSGSGAAQADPEVAKRLQSMRDELELVKLSGAARARLKAIQDLGANATKEEREEAERLATQIFELEEAQKKASGASKDSTKNDKENARVIANLREELGLAALSGLELAKARELSKLNQFATPEEVATVKALAEQLYALERLKELQKKVGDKPQEYILGDVSPLSGGMFDEQAARYQAEAQAEEERYTAQLERLREALEAQKVTYQEYYSIFEDLQQTHADRMEQIDQARNMVLLKSGEEGFAALADTMRQAKGEQSALYKAMFAASKAFAIAQSIIAIQQGIAQAAAQPWPLNLAAMASVAAATAGLVSNIQAVGLSLGGGKQYGGGVGAGKMYRINETGAPEVLNTASGRQYLLPNTRGQVVSNKDATLGGDGMAPRVTVNLIEDASRGGEIEQRQGGEQEEIIDVFVADIRGGGKASRALESTYGMRRQGR